MRHLLIALLLPACSSASFDVAGNPIGDETGTTENETGNTALDSGSVPLDSGSTDSGAVPLDTGSPPAGDTGTATTDTGATDTGGTAADTSAPPVDTGTPGTDTGTPPIDTGTTIGPPPPVTFYLPSAGDTWSYYPNKLVMKVGDGVKGTRALATGGTFGYEKYSATLYLDKSTASVTMYDISIVIDGTVRSTKPAGSYTTTFPVTFSGMLSPPLPAGSTHTIEWRVSAIGCTKSPIDACGYYGFENDKSTVRFE